MTSIIDFRKYAQNSKPHYSQIIDTTQPFVDQIGFLLDVGIKLPNHLIQAPILANYLIAPSALMEISPIMLLTGKEGTGKSQIAIFASKIHSTSIFSSASTFAAIRNALTNGRIKRIVLDKKSEDDLPEHIDLERNIFLIWDDLDPSLLIEQKQLYRILKNGYNRSTSLIQISSDRVGSNITFNCFAPKLIGSVNNFALDPRFREFKRRCLVIETKSIEDINKEEMLKDDEFTPYDYGDLLDFTQFDWKGFNQTYESFWEDDDKLSKFGNTLYEIDDVLKSSNFNWDANICTISRELMAIGVISNLFVDIGHCALVWNDYWSLFMSSSKDKLKVLKPFFIQFLAKEIERVDEFNLSYKANIPCSIKQPYLNLWLDNLVSTGDLPCLPTAIEVKEIMLSLGWYLSGYDWIKKG